MLEVLLLSGNDIGEDGARHLMSALASNNSLKYLGLNGSNLTCRPLAQVLNFCIAPTPSCTLLLTRSAFHDTLRLLIVTVPLLVYSRRP